MECLRLKIIERLLKEGSSAEEPINIQLSDYSSDEGSSSSSDNEGKGSLKDFSNLEGICCHPLRVPPCSPELDVQIRKFRYGRMRKVMQELDRIYFQPLFHKKYQILINAKHGTLKKRRRKFNKIAAIKKSIQSLHRISETGNLENTPQLHNVNPACNTITLRYVNDKENKNLPRNMSSSTTNIEKRRKRLKAGQDPINKKPLVKVSRKLRLWLTKRQIFIVRRKLPHKIKYRLRSLPRRKKEERLLLDMPTTDPGSDLLFSTDDEYVDAIGINASYATMPRIRRNLLKSELQRRYIEEIGDGLRKMPPELIITSPPNKGKHKNHNVRIVNKPCTERYERKPQTTKELPYIGVQQPAKRTSSWHNLNATGLSPTLTPNRQTVITKNRLQSPSYRPLIKKEPLGKESLDIKLSLKKKIWTGIQPADDNILTVDRNRPLSWMTPATLKTSKNKLNGLSGHQANTKNSDTEAFLTACTKKLMEWQMTNSNSDSPRCNQRNTIPLKLTVPNLEEEHVISLYKDLANIKQHNTTNPLANLDNDNNKTRPKRTTISKIAETNKTLTKVFKSKIRNTLATTNRSSIARQTRINKFKTSGIVVTAVQKGTTRKEVGGTAKKSTKTKPSQNKLPNTNISNENNNNNNSRENRRPSTQKSASIISSNGGGLSMAVTASTIARKVKTKLKKKKSSSTSQNTNSFITIYNNNKTKS